MSGVKNLKTADLIQILPVVQRNPICVPVPSPGFQVTFVTLPLLTNLCQTISSCLPKLDTSKEHRLCNILYKDVHCSVIYSRERLRIN